MSLRQLMTGIILLSALVATSACTGTTTNSSATDTSGTDTGSDTGDVTSSISVNAVSDDSVQVSIPLDALGGDENALSEKSVDVRIDSNYLVVGVDPSVYFYDSDAQEMRMLLSSATIQSVSALTKAIPQQSSSATISAGSILTVSINDLASSQSTLYTTTLSASDSSEVSSSATSGQTFVSRITTALCNRIISCTSSEIGINQLINCTEDLANTNQLSYEFTDLNGTDASDETTNLTDMSDQIDDGTYSVNSTELNNCASWLENLPCTTSEAEAASPDVTDPGSIEIGFDSSDPMNFDNIENIIVTADSECTNVITTL